MPNIEDTDMTPSAMQKPGGIQSAISGGMQVNQTPSGNIQPVPGTQLQTSPVQMGIKPPEDNAGTLTKNTLEGTLTKYRPVGGFKEEKEQG